MSCFWRTKIVYFTSFKDQFNPRKWKKQSLKVQNFEEVNSAICAIFALCHCKNLAAARWSDFPRENFYFKIFFNAVSITFGLRYIHGQSLTEIDSRPETQWTGFRETLSYLHLESNPYRNKPQDIIAQYAWLALLMLDSERQKLDLLS